MLAPGGPGCKSAGLCHLYCVGLEGNVCPGQAFVPEFRPGARRFCSLMVYNNNRKQALADRGLSPSVRAVAARLDACTERRACSGRHPATVSLSVLTVACWNIRLVVDPFVKSTTPSSGAHILRAKG